MTVVNLDTQQSDPARNLEALTADACELDPADHAAALRVVSSVELLSKTEMRACFPDATLLLDTVGPMTKSLICARGSDRVGRGAPRRGIPLTRLLDGERPRRAIARAPAVREPVPS